MNKRDKGNIASPYLNVDKMNTTSFNRPDAALGAFRAVPHMRRSLGRPSSTSGGRIDAVPLPLPVLSSGYSLSMCMNKIWLQSFSFQAVLSFSEISSPCSDCHVSGSGISRANVFSLLQVISCPAGGKSPKNIEH